MNAPTLPVLVAGGGIGGRAVGTERMRLMDATDEGEVANLPVGEAFRARFGNPYAVIHRADIRTSLLEGVQATERIELVTSTRVERVEQPDHGVAVLDAKGGIHRGIALIGCDGVQYDIVVTFHSRKQETWSVTDGDFAQAFALCERSRVARTARVVLSAREMGRLHHAKNVERLVRNDLWRGRAPERFHGALEWLYGWRVDNCLAH